MNIKTFNNKNNKSSTNTIKRVIPVDNDKVMIIKKEELINSLNIVSAFTNLNTKLVKLEINWYQNQTGEETGYMEANYEDKEKIVIEFNNNYLLEILKKMETETVRFKLKGKMFAIFILICYLYYIIIIFSSS